VGFDDMLHQSLFLLTENPVNIHKLFSLSTVLFAAVFFAGAAGSVSAQSPNVPAQGNSRFAPLTVLYKPNAGYTESARANRTQGTVKLQVVFLANGTVGEVSVLTALPHGLTERAVDAARKIRFTPKSLDGKPMDETTTVEYKFNLFYDDEDEGVRTKVSISSTPAVLLRGDTLPASFNGKVPVRVFFPDRGNASIYESPEGVTGPIRSRVEEAVRGIKFRPAVHINGSRVSVVRTVILDVR
jgi:TonB family protein